MGKFEGKLLNRNIAREENEILSEMRESGSAKFRIDRIKSDLEGLSKDATLLESSITLIEDVFPVMRALDGIVDAQWVKKWIADAERLSKLYKGRS